MPLQQKTAGDKVIKSLAQDIAQARPKIFRRPSGMEDAAQDILSLVQENAVVSHHTIAHDDNSAALVKNKPTHIAVFASDKHFGAILIVLLIIMNALIAYVLSAIKPTVSPDIQSITQSIEVVPYKPKENSDVNVYSTPVPVRRTATYLSLDSAADSTDTMIKQMPTLEPSVEFE